MTAISLDIYNQIDSMTLEAHRRESRISSFAKVLKFFSFIRTVFNPKWLSNKIIKQFNEITHGVEELLPGITELSKEDAEKLYEKIGRGIKTLIKLKDKIESINYLENPELEKTVKQCLDSFYIMEARLKKVAKKGNRNPADSELKGALNTKSMESISSKLTK